MKRILIVAALMLLSACSLVPTKPSLDQTVYVDRTIKCSPPPVHTPTDFPFDHATPDMTDYQKVQLAIAELEIYRGYTKELEAVKKACTSDTPLDNTK